MTEMRPLILAILLPLSLLGRDRWHDPPLALDAGAVAVDTIPAGAAYAVVNARLEPRRAGVARWRLWWGPDSAIATAIVSMPDARSDVAGYSQPTRITLMAAGTVMEAEVPADPGPFSLRLVYDGYGARLLGGYGHAETLFATVPYDAAAQCVAAISASQPMKCRRFGAEWIGGEAPAFTDMHAVDAAMSASGSDPLAGEWEYLDRDIAPGLATLGGKYTVAIVPAGDEGAYDIVYLSGADVGGWRAGQVKGRLKPSGFAGNYDLEWLDARGMRLADDNDAQLDSALGILTLRFPVYKSQIRMRRKR